MCALDSGVLAGVGLETARSAVPAPAGLPCLNSNNSTTHPLNEYQSNHRKTAFALKENILAMVVLFGLARIGMLTLTFADHVTDPKEARRRFNSLATHVLKGRYVCWLAVFERQKSGRIHFHVLVAFAEGDIRTGVNFEELEREIYTSASPQLRAEWAFWRETAPAYGFGRTELLPVKKTGEIIGKYVGKYIAKHIANRLPEDKGVRLVRYSQTFTRVVGTRFGWVGRRSWLYRKKLAQFVASVPCARDNLETDIPPEDQIRANMRIHYGPKWQYNLAPHIFAEQLENVPYPTKGHAAADGRDVSALPDSAVDIFFVDENRPF